MQSRDAAFWKEAIDDEIGSIMENDTWALSNLPPDCKPLGCKWIFKKEDEIARITTIRLLALVATHNLVIHQMDVKTAFLNGDLDEKVYMKLTEGFVMPGNEHDYKLSSKFSMKYMGEADVILGIKIKRENKGIVITQSHYIEKILKKFNREDCSPVNTPMDPVEKLKLNTRKLVNQLKYLLCVGGDVHAWVVSGLVGGWGCAEGFIGTSVFGFGVFLYDDIVVLENSETKEEDVKEDEFDHNKERYTFEDDDDDGRFDDLD
ncbi:zinc finger, CCHC-type containing protein [Tanacetum coccineum]